MAAQQFHIGDLITVTTGRLVAHDHMDAVYRIVDHMLGPGHMTHELPSAMKDCRPALLEQHPWLGEIDGDDLTSRVRARPGQDVRDVCFGWVDELADRYGAYHEVGQLEADR